MNRIKRAWESDPDLGVLLMVLCSFLYGVAAALIARMWLS